MYEEQVEEFGSEKYPSAEQFVLLFVVVLVVVAGHV